MSMCGKKCSKMWAIAIIAIAVILAIMALAWPQDRIADIIYVTRFFDVMIPILAVGALVKYLCGCSTKCCCGKCDNGTCAK